MLCTGVGAPIGARAHHRDSLPVLVIILFIIIMTLKQSANYNAYNHPHHRDSLLAVQSLHVSDVEKIIKYVREKIIKYVRDPNWIKFMKLRCSIYDIARC